MINGYFKSVLKFNNCEMSPCHLAVDEEWQLVWLEAYEEYKCQTFSERYIFPF